MKLLVQIDLASDASVRTISFDSELAPQGSYLNDVRFHPDGRTAYITDSGAKGALLVVDLQSGAVRRLLDGHPSTQPEKDVVVKIDGFNDADKALFEQVRSSGEFETIYARDPIYVLHRRES